ncbi:MAG: hypothetical protein ACRD4O_08780, partial [Bryobacteraceae bacterium]
TRVYTLTVDPKLSFPIGRGSFYLLAGGGWLRRTVQFTKPVLATTYIFGPWWGYFGPALVPASQVLGSVSDNAGVWEVGSTFLFLAREPSFMWRRVILTGLPAIRIRKWCR